MNPLPCSFGFLAECRGSKSLSGCWLSPEVVLHSLRPRPYLPVVSEWPQQQEKVEALSHFRSLLFPLLPHRSIPLGERSLLLSAPGIRLDPLSNPALTPYFKVCSFCKASFALSCYIFTGAGSSGMNKNGNPILPTTKMGTI